MLASRATREAFDLEAEPAKVRDRYGRNRTGQAMLLARRLVEAEDAVYQCDRDAIESWAR